MAPDSPLRRASRGFTRRFARVVRSKRLLAVAAALVVSGVTLAVVSGGPSHVATVGSSAHAATPRKAAPTRGLAAATTTTTSTSVTTMIPIGKGLIGGASTRLGLPAIPPSSPSPTSPPIAPPTTPPTPASPGPCPGGGSCIIPGENGVVEALDAVRVQHGLQPISGWANAAPSWGIYPQQCALSWSGHNCATNEAMSGVVGSAAPGSWLGAAAVDSWMSTSSANLLLEPGIGPSGQYSFHAYVGVAWVKPNPVTGGGYVVVLDICADSPNVVSYCPT